MKTNEEYVTSSNHCPICSSDQIEGGSFDVDDGYCAQEITCNSCDSVWNDIYQLTTFDLVENGANER